MSRTVRSVVIITAATLWLSGLLWMVLHFFFKSAGEFGIMPNPWEASVVRIHGMIGVLMVFMLGWISGTHVAIRWWQIRTHVHGLILLIISILLLLSGYALYYIVDDSPRHIVSVIHQVVGAFVVIIAIIHWRSRRSRNQ